MHFEVLSTNFMFRYPDVFRYFKYYYPENLAYIFITRMLTDSMSSEVKMYILKGLTAVYLGFFSAKYHIFQERKTK